MARGKNKSARQVLSSPRTSKRDKLAETMPSLADQQLSFSDLEINQAMMQMEQDLNQYLKPLLLEFETEWSKFKQGMPSAFEKVYQVAKPELITNDLTIGAYQQLWGLASLWHLLGNERRAKRLAQEARLQVLNLIEEMSVVQDLIERWLPGQAGMNYKTVKEIIKDLENYIISYDPDRVYKEGIASKDLDLIASFKQRVGEKDFRFQAQANEYNRAERNLAELGQGNWHADDLNERAYYLSEPALKDNWPVISELINKTRIEWERHCRKTAREAVYSGKAGIAPTLLWDGLAKLSCWSQDCEEYHEKLKSLVLQAQIAQDAKT